MRFWIAGFSQIVLRQKIIQNRSRTLSRLVKDFCHVSRETFEIWKSSLILLFENDLSICCTGLWTYNYRTLVVMMRMKKRYGKTPTNSLGKFCKFKTNSNHFILLKFSFVFVGLYLTPLWFIWRNGEFSNCCYNLFLPDFKNKKLK